MADVLVSVILEQLALVEQEVGSAVGVKEEVQKLTNNLEDVRAVLEDAERRQVKEPIVKGWLIKLKDVFYNMDNVLDEWNTAILKMRIEGDENLPKPKRKVCYFIPSSCFCYRQVNLHHDIAVKIKELNKTLDVISIEKDRFKFNLARGNEGQITVDTTDVSEVYGRDHEKNKIVDMLLSESSQGPTLHTISIEGMRGIGKTTLAHLIFNDDTVKTHFQKRIWVCVSDPFDEIRIAKAILEALKGKDPDSNELESPFGSLRNSIEGKKFLLVLDGVWTEDNRKFEQLKSSLMGGSPGSRILVTTHKGTIAKVIGTIDPSRLEQLSNDECWSLFSEVAFFGKSSKEREILEGIGRKITEKCKGLPFAAKVLGSLLRLKETKEEWESVLSSEVWLLKESERVLSPPLLLSYYELSPTLKRCFSYCAIFPKGYEIEKDRLIKLWMAQGYLRVTDSIDMEMVGEECFEKLAMHSFFQDFKKDSCGTVITCKMHDRVHDFAQFLTKKECSVMEVIGLNRLRLNYNHLKVRHSMFILEGEVSIFAPVEYVKNLRSLIVEYKRVPLSGETAFEIDQFTCLRTLDYRCSLKKLPNEIGNLMHLRCLNVAYNYELIELPETVCNLCNLQSLNVSHCKGLKILPRELGKLINLRHLEVASSGVSFLPEGFERLTSLRYLNLAYNYELIELPETVCDLCNLQTLNVSHCTRLEKLPRGLEKLIKLRHLEFVSSGVSLLPKGLERLTCLRTLDKFVVSNDSEASKIGDLKNLNQLRGYLEIVELGKERDVDEVRKAQLENKEHLIALVLDFGLDGGSKEVIEAIQPPPNLEELSIRNYEGGNVFPNWIMSLTNLKKVQISWCWNCKILPPLGKLSCLESLFIERMRGVERVGIEFLGIESEEVKKKKEEGGPSTSKAKTSSLSVIAFPQLKQLHFDDLLSWEEWEDIATATATGGSTVIIMPRLHSLTIKSCPWLKALPDHILQSTSLKELKITRCSYLNERYYPNKRKGEEWHKIAHIPNIIIDEEYVQKDGQPQ